MRARNDGILFFFFRPKDRLSNRGTHSIETFPRLDEVDKLTRFLVFKRQLFLHTT